MDIQWSAVLFPVYVICHFTILIWSLWLWKTHKAPGAPLVAMIAAALTYDNLIVSLGASIGIGSVLQMLSWPRFAMHALLTPFMMVAVTQIGEAGGVRWAASPRWKTFIWVLVASMIVVGAFEGLIGLETVPACYDGIVRYTANLHPSHFCNDTAVAVQGSGPPIPSIVGNFITLIIGFALWRHTGWVWLMLGALLMFCAAAFPFSVFGMAPGNGGEVVLMFSYVVTLARFGKFRKSSISTS